MSATVTVTQYRTKEEEAAWKTVDPTITFAKELIDCGILDAAGVAAVEAETEPANAASQAVLRKVGFVPTGTVGKEGPRFILRCLPA